MNAIPEPAKDIPDGQRRVIDALIDDPEVRVHLREAFEEWRSGEPAIRFRDIQNEAHINGA